MILQRRATRRQSELSRQRIWTTRDKDGKIVESRSLLGLGRRYLAVVCLSQGEYTVSSHRTRNAAVKALARVLQ